MGRGFQQKPLQDQWSALFMLTLNYHLSSVISCCVLQNRGNMNTMWHSINHTCQSGETQWITLKSAAQLSVWVGDKAFSLLALPRGLLLLGITGSVLEIWTNILPPKSKRWATGWHLSSLLITLLRTQCSPGRDSDNNSFFIHDFYLGLTECGDGIYWQKVECFCRHSQPLVLLLSTQLLCCSWVQLC